MVPCPQDWRSCTNCFLHFSTASPRWRTNTNRSLRSAENPEVHSNKLTQFKGDETVSGQFKWHFEPTEGNEANLLLTDLSLPTAAWFIRVASASASIWINWINGFHQLTPHLSGFRPSPSACFLNPFHILCVYDCVHHISGFEMLIKCQGSLESCGKDVWFWRFLQNW